jgi:hypothetical protein
MSERYKIIHKLDKALYAEGAPVIIKAGALVSDTEKGRLHVQLKFQNIVDKTITLLKAKVTLMDSIGRPLNELEKQYLDLSANRSSEFGANVAIAVTESATRQFSVIVTEVCFADGTVCSVNDAAWEEMPAQEELGSKFTSAEALKEFNLNCCDKAKYIPLVYKDVWCCSCGNVNKKEKAQCDACGANLQTMQGADDATLRCDYIYRQATLLTDKNNSADITKGIALFESIIDWKDSKDRVEGAKTQLTNALDLEKKKSAKKKKLAIKIGAISLAGVIAVTGGVLIFKAINAKNLQFELEDGYYVVVAPGSTDVEKVVVPSTHKGKPVKKIADDAFSSCYDLKEVTLPDGITSIGSNAFQSCFDLEKINFPDTLIEIGDHAFFGCDAITELSISDSVTKIGDSAFAFMDGITEVSIPDSVKICGEWAFSSCLNLEKVTLGKGMKSIPNCMFYDCGKLENVEIPNHIMSIGSSAFKGCKSLKEIVIPSSVTTIDYNVFKECSSLTIYCQATAKGKNWSYSWNDDRPVVWGYNGK